MARNFMEMLRAKMAEGKSLCVGLDTNVDEIPASFRLDLTSTYERQLAYNKMVVDCTKDLVLAFKLNIAFYRDPDKGRKVLLETIEYIREVAPDVPVILDAKRGDIGNSAEGYAFEVFSWFGADAVTVNPYMGMDSVEPFLRYENKGVIVLCRTSNPSANEFQDRLVAVYGSEAYLAEAGSTGSNLAPFYKLVAHKVATAWNTHGNCLVVVGTNPAMTHELAEVRKIVGDMPILIPGIGAQGGEVKATVEAGQDSKGNGMLISSSRAVIFAGNGNPESIRSAAVYADAEITTYRRASK